MKQLTTLIIMDGFGLRENTNDNAITHAKTPNLDALFAKYPHTQIACSGMSVGLPRGQMGNSEVGHLNLGAGRVVYQPLTRISKAIEDGDFFTNPALKAAMDNAVQKGTALHAMGLVSDGGVHSHMEHLLAVVKMAKDAGIKKIYIHAFMDGRDVPPSSGLGYIQQLEGELKALGAGKIATVAGRFWAMDRDNIWEREERAWDAMVKGQGVTAASAEEAMQQSYDKGETDEFVQPTVVTEGGKPIATIGENDSVVFFNFRPDRARQLTRAFVDPAFKGFERPYFKTCFVTMTPYDETLPNVQAAFLPLTWKNTLGEYLSSLNLKQLRIAETQKYAHVTYFFNGGVEAVNPGEDRVLIDSPKIATFDMKPEMSAYEVTDEVEKRIASGEYDFIIMNYANCDMVGHTGVMEAAVKAVEAVDACVGRVVKAVQAVGGKLIVTADHGNAEQMWDEEANAPYTAHTVSNPVPLMVVDDRFLGCALKDGGCLADVAPTLLALAGIAQPEEMTGKSLLPEGK